MADAKGRRRCFAASRGVPARQPTTPDRVARAARHAASEPAIKARVLILDEDRIILGSLAQFLRATGMRPARPTTSTRRCRCSTPASSSCCWPTSTSPARLAEFLGDVRRRHPHVVIVVVTSYGSIDGAVEATKLGAFDYLTKPIVDEEIRVVVEKAAPAAGAAVREPDAQAAARRAVRPGQRRRPRPPMGKIFDLVGAVADGRTTVLMAGESGTASRCSPARSTTARRGATSRSSR